MLAASTQGDLRGCSGTLCNCGSPGGGWRADPRLRAENWPLSCRLSPVSSRGEVFRLAGPEGSGNRCSSSASEGRVISSAILNESWFRVAIKI